MALSAAGRRVFMSVHGSITLPAPDSSIDTVDRALFVDWLYPSTTITPPGPEVALSGFGGVIIDEDGGTRLQGSGGVLLRGEGGIKLGFSTPTTMLYDPYGNTR